MYRVGYFGEENTLKMIQSLSLGISLQPGTSIISDNKLLAHGKFTICTQIGCEAISVISDDDLKLFSQVIITSLVLLMAMANNLIFLYRSMVLKRQ